MKSSSVASSEEIRLLDSYRELYITIFASFWDYFRALSTFCCACVLISFTLVFEISFIKLSPASSPTNFQMFNGVEVANSIYSFPILFTDCVGIQAKLLLQ